ncbi:MAG TPA: alpha/beta hydrolase [Dehalococcoidia bacterium]|nr:alpha/beta hydrolase [Dehalococcoidia bacterium]
MPIANINGINLFYKVHGRGEPLVLITGLGGGHGAWFFQLRSFKKHFQCITMDNRGIGRTDKPSEHYTLRTMADDIAGLMNYLGIDKAHVVGISMGGMISQEVAINHPERVKKLVLGCTAATTSGTGGVHSDLMEALGIGEDATEADIDTVSFKRIINNVIPLGFNKRFSKIFIVPFAKIYMKRLAGEGIVGQFKAIMSHNTLDRLHLIKAPTLVITGTADRLVPPESSDILASQIPNARLVKVEGGSHSFLVEMSKRFNREVLDFLRA